MTDLSLYGTIILPIIFGLFLLKTTHFRKRIINLQKDVHQKVDDTYNQFECIIYSRRKIDRNPEKILNLAAKYDAWKDNERKLEKSYKENRRNEKIDYYLGMPLFGIAVLLAFIEFEGDTVCKVVVFLISMPIFGYIIYISSKSYRLINNMEDKLGIGKTESIK